MKSRSRTPRAFSVTPGSVQGSRPARILSHTCQHRRGASVNLVSSKCGGRKFIPRCVAHRSQRLSVNPTEAELECDPSAQNQGSQICRLLLFSPTLAAGDHYALTATNSAALGPCCGGCQALLLTSFAFPVPPNPSPKFCRFCRIDFPPAPSPPPSTTRPCSGAISSAQSGWKRRRAPNGGGSTPAPLLAIMPFDCIPDRSTGGAANNMVAAHLLENVTNDAKTSADQTLREPMIQTAREQPSRSSL